MSCEMIQSVGMWPRYSAGDVQSARAAIQSMGFVGIEPVLVVGEKLYEVLHLRIPNCRHSNYRSFFLRNDLLSRVEKDEENIIPENQTWFYAVNYKEEKINIKEPQVIIENIEVDKNHFAPYVEDNVFRFESSGAWPEHSIIDIGRAFFGIAGYLCTSEPSVLLVSSAPVIKSLDGIIPNTSWTYRTALKKIFRIDEIVEVKKEFNESISYANSCALISHSLNGSPTDAIGEKTVSDIFHIKME